MQIHELDSKLMRLAKCPACGGSSRKKLFALNPYDVYECSGCRLRYIDPCLSPEGMQYYYSSEERLLELNPFHRSYYDYGDPAAPGRTVLDFTRALELLEKGPGTEGEKIFDVGCGNGLFLSVAQRRGWQVFGCEPSAGNVALAKSKFGLNVYCSDFNCFDPQREKYDVVSFWDVLEHLVEPHVFLGKAIGMLKPEGKIVIGGPNDRSLLRVLAAFAYHMTAGRVQKPLRKAYLLEHVTYYTAATMEKLFAKHGFAMQCSFMSGTDLKKYHFPLPEKLLASTVLAAGKLLGLQNRMIAVFKARA